MNLLNESAHYIISNQNSSYCYFMFSGSPETKKRISNFIHNYGVTTGVVESYNDAYDYCLVPFERLKKCLLDLFANEIILSRAGIDYEIVKDSDGEITDVCWSDDKVSSLARRNLEEFLNKLEYKSMFSSFERATAYAEHAMGQYQDAEPEMLTA